MRIYMDSAELEAAWEKICCQIKSYNTVESSQVEAFFSRLEPQAMSSGFLMLTADNEFIRNWIGTHYLSVIKSALKDIYGVNFEVLIEVNPGQSVPTPQEPPQQTGTPSIQTPSIEVSHQPPSTLNQAITTFPEPQKGKLSPISTQKVTSEGDFSPTSSLTFENFVIGDSNRMAYSMAVAVAEMPGSDLRKNPLFIYGKSGLGKTHLLRSIQNYIQNNIPELKVVYVDSSELVSDYTEASVAHDKEKASYKNFKKRYEGADVLLIDDVQSLQGKKQTLEIVFQIFNNLVSRGHQIVLSADRAPKNIDIDERYQSRFNSGATVDIQPPEIETKMGIVKTFIDEYKETEGDSNLEISQDIQLYIAENSGSNIRELKSAVTKIISQIVFFNQRDISLSEVEKLLENHFSGRASNHVTISDVQKAVESFYKISHSDLVGTKKIRAIAHTRQVAIYLCRQLTEMPYNDIGQQFNRDHSTVMYAVKNIEAKLKENRELREEIELLTKSIKEM